MSKFFKALKQAEREQAEAVSHPVVTPPQNVVADRLFQPVGDMVCTLDLEGRSRIAAAGTPDLCTTLAQALTR